MSVGIRLERDDRKDEDAPASFVISKTPPEHEPHLPEQVTQWGHQYRKKEKIAEGWVYERIDQ